PNGISSKQFSTNRATNGAAPILNGTMAAFMPIDVPTKARVNGIIQTMSMMKGMERKMFTKKAIVLLSGLFASNCRSRVKNNNMPKGSPSIKLKKPAANVIAIVSQVPLANNQNVASDITVV